MTDLESRLRVLEDQMAVQQLAARFTDAVNERNVPAFDGLWASDGAIWEIGRPLAARAQGQQNIVAMLGQLMRIQTYFMQLTHSGVITIEGDRATARWDMRERGKGDGSYYDNLAVYDDVLVRERHGWRFLSRSYTYRFLDQSAFAGEAFQALQSPS
jgi:ketosteroid isomerase-like protein